MEQKTTDTRTYINRHEYDALLELFGSLSCIEKKKQSLRGRAEKANNAYQDLEQAGESLETALTKIARTIPIEKLMRLQKEMDTLVVRVEQKGRGYTSLPVTNELYGFFPWKPIGNLVDYLLGNECYMCEKMGGEASQCPYRKMLQDLYPFFVAKKNEKGACVFSGLRSLEQ